MTHRWEGDTVETLVTIRLVALDGDETRLALTQERLPDTVDPDSFRRWWRDAFGALDVHLRKETVMDAKETQNLCRAYFDAWTHRRGPDALRPLLAEGFVFAAGPMRIEGRDHFLQVAAWPNEATTTMVADAYDGDHGLQLYEAANQGAHVRIAEHLTVHDGLIVSTETITDQATFAAFMAGSA
jgi:hypothetical protein